MTYRQVELDFQGIHLAVLTGENGAGKSSLLDAITWALWGKARARRDDELIHLGCLEMEVEYTFGLGDNLHRIIRKRDASRKGRSDLSFQAYIPDAGGWRTLTEINLRATQNKINEIIRLDYDTFINSAFLLQGRADEFTTKPPGKRKEILSDILNLQIYDVYAERAKKRANEQEKEAAGIVAQIEQIERELAREAEYRLELVEAEQEAARLNQDLRQAEQEMLELRDRHRAINDKQRQLDNLQERLRGVEADIAETNEAIAAAQAKIAEYQTILARRSEVENGLAQLSQARATVKDWERRLRESAKLADHKYELDRALNAARAKIEADLREVATTINHLIPKAEAIESLGAQLAEAQQQLDSLQRLSEDRETQQAVAAHLKEETARLTEQNRQLKIEMDELKTQLTQLEQAGFNCPICRRPLDETHQQEVLAQFQQEGKSKGDVYRANKARLAEIANQQEQLKQSIAAADQKLRELATLQGKVATLKQSLTEATTAAAALEKAHSRQVDLQQRLERQEFAAEVVAQLEEVQAELAALGYDDQAHQQAQAEVESLSHFEDEGRTLAEAEKYIVAEEERLAKEQGRSERLLAQTATDRTEIARLAEETKDLPALSQQLNQASDAVNNLQRQERFARDKVAAANQKLKYVADMGKRRGGLEDKLQQVRETLGIYRELQAAFGKKGVQALLIESAIPEIEDEANKLLSRMTDGRMHIRFETQRETRSGDGTIETLDIRISDQIGTRDYELYSGGEAFRVNFAIRVAMSKVLARRAGARLQTLVMDEGFGTQDLQGRERLVEAINAIQDDFEKIIVITHIDELKDAFPVQIDVWKTPEGSQVAIR